VKGSDVARDRLLDVGTDLIGSSDADVRWLLAAALGQNSTDGRVSSLLLVLMRDADEDVRYQATVGIALPAGDEPEGGGPVTDALLGALDDPSAEVRDWAVFGLGSSATWTRPG
jgi:HEAT repeat protein